jgi:epsilon-lactone hydrolase
VVDVDDAGTIRVEALKLDGSAGWSAAARRMFIRRMARPPLKPTIESADAPRSDAEQSWLATARAYRTNMETLHRQLLVHVEQDHPCDVEDDVVGGVAVRWVTPADGVAPSRDDCVLVNLHGGAFLGGAECCGLVESLPIASLGGYRICVVDYRQGWEHRFPAATKDVLAVHVALSQRYRPQRIGVFGYSAGGMLAAQSVAAMVRHGVDLPGAVAMCSAGAGGGGDSWTLASVAMGEAPFGPADDARVALGAHTEPAQFGYAAGVDPTDPTYAPIHSPEVLAAFPPTMLLTGSRSFDASTALVTHRALLAAGADAELHMWEAMWHCFPYNHRLPESVDAFATLGRFFDRHLVDN